MIKLLIFISSLLSNGDRVDTSAFYNWWETTAYQQMHDAAPKGVRDKYIPFAKIETLQPKKNSLPRQCDGHTFKSFCIYKSSNYSIILAVPLDSGCTISWLRVSTYSTWVPIDLYPFTSDCYGTEDVDCRLFWIPDEKMPYIEVITNGPACIPMDLYRFDPKEKIYTHVRHLCSA